jgi:hypothetical protein
MSLVLRAARMLCNQRATYEGEGQGFWLCCGQRTPKSAGSGAGGGTVPRWPVLAFAAEHPHFTDDDHEVLQSWREVVAGALEIRQQAEDSIIATQLGDDRDLPHPGQRRACGPGADVAVLPYDRLHRPGRR